MLLSLRNMIRSGRRHLPCAGAAFSVTAPGVTRDRYAAGRGPPLRGSDKRSPGAFSSTA